MPINDPLEKEIAAKVLLDKKICMNCYATNPLSADKCRRCQSPHLRSKKKKLRTKGV